MPVLLRVFVAITPGACWPSKGGSGPCASDAAEINDSPQTAFDLGEMSDFPDSTKDVTLSIHSAQDVDFFELHVKDDGLGGDPVIYVTAPEGYEVTTWFTCKRGGITEFSCMQGDIVDESAISMVRGCRSNARFRTVASKTSCSRSADDDGEVLIRVRRIEPTATCEKYALAIAVR